MTSVSAEDFIEQFETGRPIALTHEDELTVTENRLVNHYLPPYTDLATKTRDLCKANWAARERLYDAIRGSKFFGQLVDISVCRLENPLDSLRDSGMYNRGLSRSLVQPSVIGMSVNGVIDPNNAASGNVNRHVWYVRVSNSRNISASSILYKRFIGEDTGQSTIDDTYKRVTERAPATHMRGVTNGKSASHK